MNKFYQYIILTFGLLFWSTNSFAQCVGDVTAPNAVCQAGYTAYLDAVGQVTVDAADIDDNSSDNCGIAQLLINTNPTQTYTCTAVGTTPTVTLTVVDSAGNQSTCQTTITIVDTIAPLASCQSSISVILDQQAQASLQAVDVNSNSTDNCGLGGVFFSITPSSFDCSDVGTQSVTLTVTDASGNVDSCQTTVSVLDTTAPVLDCPSTLQTFYINNNGLAIVEAAALNINALDSCTIDTWLINGQAKDTFDCNQVGNFVTPTITVIDQGGNSDACVVTATIADSISPYVQCAAPASFTLSGSGTLTFPTATINAGSFDNCSITSYQVNGQPAPTLTCADLGAYQYTLTATDASGNTASCQSSIDVQWSAACGFYVQADSIGKTGCDTTQCTGYISLNVFGGTTPYTVSWDDGGTGNTRNNLCAGPHTAIVNDAGSNVDTITVIVPYQQGCVWPGDTDDNAIVNNFDLLPIALTYGSTGVFRPNATTNWIGQSCLDWNVANPISGLADYKHVDSDGNSVVDSFDVRAIDSNYTQSYPKSTQLSPQGATAPPIFVSCDTVGEGDIACMSVHLGNVSAPAINAYAIAFTIDYDPLVTIPGTATITYTPSWLGTTNELISVQRDFPTLGRLETAVGRIDQQPITGFGKIGTFCIGIRDDVLKTTIPDTFLMPIRFRDVRLIDQNNNTKAVTPFDGCLVIIEVIDGLKLVQHPDAAVNIYPNPANQNIQLTAEKTKIQQLTIRTVTGQTVRHLTTNRADNYTVDIAGLPEAVYLITIKTTKGIFNKRLIIER